LGDVLVLAEQQNQKRDQDSAAGDAEKAGGEATDAAGRIRPDRCAGTRTCC